MFGLFLPHLWHSARLVSISPDLISFEKAELQAAVWVEEAGNIEICDVEHIKIIKYLNKAPSELVSPIRSVISKIVDDNDITAILSFL